MTLLLGLGGAAAESAISVGDVMQVHEWEGVVAGSPSTMRRTCPRLRWKIREKRQKIKTAEKKAGLGAGCWDAGEMW